MLSNALIPKVGSTFSHSLDSRRFHDARLHRYFQFFTKLSKLIVSSLLYKNCNLASCSAPAVTLCVDWLSVKRLPETEMWATEVGYHVPRPTHVGVWPASPHFLATCNLSIEKYESLTSA